MANTSLPNLTERTATANTDLIHVNSGGTDYKETKGNFLSDVNSSITSLNNSLTQRLIDISSSFVVNSSLNPTGYNVKAFYDPYTHSVRGSLFISTSSTFDTSVAIFTISNSAYRPSASVSIIGLITANNTRYPYNGNINSDGTVKQAASGICTGVWSTFEYNVA